MADPKPKPCECGVRTFFAHATESAYISATIEADGTVTVARDVVDHACEWRCEGCGKFAPEASERAFSKAAKQEGDAE